MKRIFFLLTLAFFLLSCKDKDEKVVVQGKAPYRAVPMETIVSCGDKCKDIKDFNERSKCMDECIVETKGTDLK